MTVKCCWGVALSNGLQRHPETPKYHAAKSKLLANTKLLQKTPTTGVAIAPDEATETIWSNNQLEASDIKLT